MRRLSPRLRTTLQVLALASLYILTGKLGFLFAVSPGNVTPVWFPSGLALAALMRWGRPLWPGVWIGSALLNVWFVIQTSGFSPLALEASAVIATGSTLQALLGAWLVQRWIGPGGRLVERMPEVLTFAGVAALSCLVAATIGVAGLCAAEYASWAAYGRLWWMWWLGDCVGILLVTPWLFVWKRSTWDAVVARPLESALLVSLLFLGAFTIFGAAVGTLRFSVVYALAPLLLWAAFRFGAEGVTVSTLVVLGASMWRASTDVGPFTRSQLGETFGLLQAFLGLVTLTGLSLVAGLRERRRAERAVLEREAELKDFMEQTAVGLHWVAPDGRILWANQAELDLLGYAREEYLGHHLSEFHASQQTLDDFLGRLARHESLQDYEVQLRHKDGSLRDVLISCHARWRDGAFAHTRCFTRDITAQKQIDRAMVQLVEVSRLYGAAFFDAIAKTLAEGLGVRGVLLAELDPKDETLARTVAVWAGNAPRDPFVFAWAGTPWQQVITRGAALVSQGQGLPLLMAGRLGCVRVKTLLAAPLRGSDERIVGVLLAAHEHPLPEPDIARRILEVFARQAGAELERARVQRVHEEAVVAARNDLEERVRERTQELERSHAELEAAHLRLIQAEKMDSVGRLAAGVAHEVNNPLAALTTGIEYLLEHAAESQDAKSTLLDMHEAVRRANSAVRGLLDFSAPRKLQRRREQLSGIINEALGLLKHDLGRNRVRVITHLPPALPRLLVDPNKMVQVFINVFLNAIQAMPQGGTLTVRTSLTSLGEIAGRNPDDPEPPAGLGEQVVAAEIDDTGPGIPEEKLANLFKPVFTTKPPGAGSGLGLSVSQELMHLHGGAVIIKNRSEGGVRITLLFPLPADYAQPALAEATEAP